MYRFFQTLFIVFVIQGFSQGNILISKPCKRPNYYKQAALDAEILGSMQEQGWLVVLDSLKGYERDAWRKVQMPPTQSKAAQGVYIIKNCASAFIDLKDSLKEKIIENTFEHHSNLYDSLKTIQTYLELDVSAYNKDSLMELRSHWNSEIRLHEQSAFYPMLSILGEYACSENKWRYFEKYINILAHFVGKSNVAPVESRFLAEMFVCSTVNFFEKCKGYSDAIRSEIKGGVDLGLHQKYDEDPLSDYEEKNDELKSHLLELSHF